MQLTTYSKEKVHIIIAVLIIALIITYLLLKLIGLLVALITMAFNTLLFIALQNNLGGGAVGDLYGFTLEVSRVTALVLMSLLIGV